MTKIISQFSHLKYIIAPICCIFLLGSCQTIKYSLSNNDIQKEIRKSEVFSSQFFGFTLYDPEAKNYLCNYNDELLYTPASNTKILTTLACLENLGDSIATYLYSKSEDSIFLSPLADPSFLHPKFEKQKAIAFLKGKKIFIYYPDTRLEKFGSGWAWDDYNYGFQQERSWFPVYGNSLYINGPSDSTTISPPFFENYTFINQEETIAPRAERANIFGVRHNNAPDFEKKIPFIYSQELLGKLLEDTLGFAPTFIDFLPPLPDTLFSQSTKLALALMMQPSDNFLAEQLLIHCATMNGFQNVNEYQNHLLKKWNSFLPNEVKWVDASGLSRYNLISPKSMVSILNQIYESQDWETIESIFPIGGVSGTIKKWYINEEPYIIAKTGTLSNNHCLSGYIKTKSGKTLIFSLMNNHYLRPLNDVKLEMEQLLIKIRDAY